MKKRFIAVGLIVLVAVSLLVVVLLKHNSDKEVLPSEPSSTVAFFEKAQLGVTVDSWLKIIEIDEENNTVFLSDPEMTLDVGAIAKGYAVERIAEYLINKGVTDFLLNVGGNVRTIGMGKDNEPWKVGIENPNIEKQEEIPHIEYLKMSDMSLVTSGCYQRFYEVNGKVYFGEMTFYPDGGTDANLLAETELLFGNKLVLPNKNT